jgi:hypothetical protein
MDENILIPIENRIMMIRGKQVLLDRDLAELYSVETKVLNQTVKRNIDRFPEDFMFQLNELEFQEWRSQFVTSNSIKMGMRRKPFAYTEQGIAMLSGLLHSEHAIKMNIMIMRAFVAMRHFLLNNAQLFQRIEKVELRQSKIEDKMGRILDKMEDVQPKQGIFFDGQVFDAYVFVSKLIQMAQRDVVLIDNYVDESVLTLLDKRQTGVSARVYTSQKSRIFQLDIDKHDEQYPSITIIPFNHSHDRFLLIDDEVYLIGASLKDLGKKWFGISLMKDWTAKEILDKTKTR